MIRRPLGAVAVLAVAAVALGSAPGAGAAPSVRWTAQSVPPPAVHQAHAEFLDVACPTPAFCMAVGDHVDRAGDVAAYAATWNGRAWTTRTLGLPGGVTTLTDVACLGPARCDVVATGTGSRMMRWDGSGWRTVPLDAALRASVTDVACAGPATCVLVGATAATRSADVGFGSTDAAAWRLRDGRWRLTRVPSSSRSSLQGVSCPARNACFAAGSIDAATRPRTRPLVDRWNGRAWSRVAVGHPTRGASLADIACVRVTACTAVGAVGAQEHALVLDLGSRRWTYSYPRPRTFSSGMTAVSCLAPRACSVITTRFAPDESIRNVVLTRARRGGFHASAGYRDLNGISCRPVGCTTVGSTRVFDRGGMQLADGVVRAVVLRRTSSGFAPQTVHSPPGTVARTLVSVSCVSSGFCAATAQYPVDGPQTPAVFTRAGGRWSRGAGSRPAELSDVSCTSETFCMAVGQGRYERWNGTRWTRRAMPTPDGRSQDAIFGVSCVSPVWCDAVGTTGVDGNPGRVLVQHWDGTTWTVVAHVPSGGRLAQLDAVSCTSPTACLAVGYGLGRSQHLVERWDGTRWTILADPGLPTDLALEAVSCTAPAACMVTSSAELAGRRSTAATWNGARFRTTTFAGPAGRRDPFTVHGVSCTAANACTGVGRDDRQQAEVQRWNGTRWSIVAIAPVRGEGPELTAVSCVTTGVCTAVGDVLLAQLVPVVRSTG